MYFPVNMHAPGTLLGTVHFANTLLESRLPSELI